MANKADDEFAAFASFSGDTANGYYRLDVTTTAATFTSMPKGRYVLAFTGGLEAVGIAVGTTATDPSSGSTTGGTGAAHANGWTFNLASDANVSVIVLGGSGSGRVYFNKVV